MDEFHGSVNGDVDEDMGHADRDSNDVERNVDEGATGRGDSDEGKAARKMSPKTWKTWRMACQSTFMTSLWISLMEEEDKELAGACSEVEDERGVFDYGDLGEHIMGQQ